MTASVEFYEYSPKEILAGNYPLATDMVTVAAGQVLPEGAVLGQITSTKEYVLSLAAATDGSQVPSVILADAVDASAAADKAPVYLSGDFVARNLTFGTGHAAVSTKAGLRDLNIYLDLSA
jgi:hypothetical protein